MSTVSHPAVLADVVLSRFAWRAGARTALAVLSGALVVGLLAQVSIDLHPVPVTGQTLGVLLAGAALGARRGAAAMVTYLVLGVAGVPWFSSLTGGPAAVVSPSFGYIIGFIPAAFLIGHLSERRWDRHSGLAILACLGATILPFLTGVPYMWAVLAATGVKLSLGGALAAGFTPFILGGLIKAGIGAIVLPLAWRFARP